VSFRNEHDRTSIGSDLPPITLEDYHRSAGEAPPVPRERPERVSVVSTPLKVERGTWREDAACYLHPVPAIFFPGPKASKASKDEAKAICGSCPVQEECLAEQLRVESSNSTLMVGIYGGLEPGERLKLRREQARPAPPTSGCVVCGIPLPPRSASRNGIPKTTCSNKCQCRDYYWRNVDQERVRAAARYERRKAAAKKASISTSSSGNPTADLDSLTA
jgi:WhiB family redox-sensing transcriptional regulator